MQYQDIKWNKKTQLYILVINSFVKFGITNNWKQREKKYIKEFENQPIVLIKNFEFSNRWQAELIEQVVKWRLKKWIVYGRHEYTELSIKIVVECITETIKELSPEFHRHEYIHKRGNERWDFYRQIAEIFFKKIKFEEKVQMMDNKEYENNELPIVNLYSNSYSENLRGKSAFGIILTHKEHEKTFQKAYNFTTSNRIELLGIIYGLKNLKKKSIVTIHTKLKYIIDPFEKKWINNWVDNNWHSGKKPIANDDLWKELFELYEFHQLKFVYAEEKSLTKSQLLVKNALESEILEIDENFEITFENQPVSTLKKVKIKNEGDLCRKCDTPVIKQVPQHKKIKKNKSYYFEYYLLCPNCKEMYMVEEAKKML